MKDYSELILPQKIKGFKYTESSFNDFEQSFDTFSIVLEFQTVYFTPIVDTDEIEIKIINNESSEEYFTKFDFDRFIDKEVKLFWKCVNSQGYFDLFILGIGSLTPTLSVLSEGSSLKIIT